MINPRSKYWVLVANGGQARVLELRRKPYEFRQVAELQSETRRVPSRDLVSDGSGRSYHVQGPGSHAKQQCQVRAHFVALSQVHYSGSMRRLHF